VLGYLSFKLESLRLIVQQQPQALPVGSPQPLAVQSTGTLYPAAMQSTLYPNQPVVQPQAATLQPAAQSTLYPVQSTLYPAPVQSTLYPAPVQSTLYPAPVQPTLYPAPPPAVQSTLYPAPVQSTTLYPAQSKLYPPAQSTPGSYPLAQSQPISIAAGAGTGSRISTVALAGGDSAPTSPAVPVADSDAIASVSCCACSLSLVHVAALQILFQPCDDCCRRVVRAALPQCIRFGFSLSR
jgi:hypothetical protein